MISKRFAIALLLFTLLVGCDGEKNDLPPGGETGGTGGSGRPDTPDPCLSSPLRCSDVPPDGVENQLSVMGGGDYILFLQDGEFTDMGAIEVGTRQAIQLTGMPPYEAVSGFFTWPGGNVDQVDTIADQNGTAEWCWQALPNEPRGQYQVLARGRLSEATGTFTVQEPQYPRILVVPEYGPPGTTFSVVLAGFSPGQTVPLYLYRSDTFLTSLPPVQVDQSGQAIRSLSTQRSDPQGSYLVTFESRTRTGRFDVTTKVPQDRARCYDFP